jgi:hypothetical protein
MQSAKALEMLNKGQVEQLMAELRDEIYQESLKAKPNAKKRYVAMKKYFTYVDSVREACKKPAIIDFDGSQYTSFCNSYSLVLTTENCGEMVLFDTAAGNYPDVTRLIHFDGTEEKIDISKVIAKAKSQGYKLKKSAVHDNGYLMFYEGNYYRIGLIDATYGIINDGEDVTVYHVPNSMKPLVLKNDLGVAVIMPMRYESEPDDGVIVIEA